MDKRIQNLVEEYLKTKETINTLQNREKFLLNNILPLLSPYRRAVVEYNGNRYRITEKSVSHYVMRHNAPDSLKKLVSSDIYEELCSTIALIDADKLRKMVNKSTVSGAIISELFSILESTTIAVTPLKPRPPQLVSWKNKPSAGPSK